MDSKIKITTYVDAEKIHDESYIGTYISQLDSEKIIYKDKNNKKNENRRKRKNRKIKKRFSK